MKIINNVEKAAGAPAEQICYESQKCQADFLSFVESSFLFAYLAKS